MSLLASCSAHSLGHYKYHSTAYQLCCLHTNLSCEPCGQERSTAQGDANKHTETMYLQFTVMCHVVVCPRSNLLDSWKAFFCRVYDVRIEATFFLEKSCSTFPWWSADQLLHRNSRTQDDASRTAEAESWLKMLLTVLYKLIQIIQLQLTTKLALALARLMLCA